MGAIGRKIEELRAYQAEPTARDDFDSFWERTLHEVRQSPTGFSRKEVSTYMKGVAAYEIMCEGLDGTPIR